MTTYLHNLQLWLTGFGKLDQLDYKPSWNVWKFLPVYIFDIGLNVLTGGAVCTVSRRAQDHRSGWVWDKLLDALEHFDAQHGAVAGPPLWGSVECSKRVQIFVIAAWAAGVFLWI